MSRMINVGKKTVSALIVAVFVAVGVTALNQPGMLLGAVASLFIIYPLNCLVYVQRQTAVPLHNRLQDVTVRVLQPGWHIISFPLEKPLRPLSTKRLPPMRGTTGGCRSADGVEFNMNWTIVYRLAPQNIPADLLEANIDIFLRSATQIMPTFVGAVLRDLVSRKPASCLAGDDGRRWLKRFARPQLQAELRDEGFDIDILIVDKIELPRETQIPLNQSSVAAAETRSVAEALTSYASLGRQYTPEELAFMANLEMQRTIRKGGRIVNVVTSDGTDVQSRS